MSNSDNLQRIIFFGTSDFAVPALKALHATQLDLGGRPVLTGYNLQAVITQPDKPKGRKQEFSPSPVKLLAKELGLNILQYPSLKQPEVIGEIKSLNANCAVVASYGKIIPLEILTAFPKGCVNLHPSLLPKYRGPSPIQAALLNGDKITGTSLMVLDAELDHGPILAQKKVKILNNETYKSLHDRLAQESADLLVEILPEYMKGELTLKPQNHIDATFTKLLEREDGRIDWNEGAVQIYNKIRAFFPWPGTWTVFQGNRLKIIWGKPARLRKNNFQIGSMIKKDNKIFVACGHSTFLEIIELQKEGKNKMNPQEFLRGHSLTSVRLG